jgi:hypothetical protein
MTAVIGREHAHDHVGTKASGVHRTGLKQGPANLSGARALGKGAIAYIA